MLLEGHDLYGHLDGSKLIPAKTITRNNTEEDNPSYRLWIHQDRLIQQAMMTSVDTTIASTVAGASNGQKAWALLHTSYANKSHTVSTTYGISLAELPKMTRMSQNISTKSRQFQISWLPPAHLWPRKNSPSRSLVV